MLFNLAVNSTFRLRLFVVVFGCYVVVYLCGYLVVIVIFLVSSCVVCYFLDVDQIMAGC